MEVKLFDSIEEAKRILPNNEPKLVKALDKSICIVRKEDQLISFLNECPHQGASLHQGTVNYLGEIVCPLHSYRFNMKTGETAEKACKPLTLIPVVISDAVYLDV